MDFTLKTYRQLLTALQQQGFSFQTFQEFIEQPKEKSIVLRHDVDKLPENSLRFAQIQNELGIKGSYYFRIVKQNLPDGNQGFKPEIIEEIARLGHEIGYHYETFDEAVKSFKHQTPNTKFSEKEIAAKAIELFEKHLAEFRKLYPVKTICMHGSPRSKFDNKLLWKYYNYRDYGIIGEPYFDVNFDEVFYLTDTGRRWDGWKVSVRDKVPQQEQWKEQGLVFGTTQDIIKAAEQNRLPSRIMFTFHPQRWTKNTALWAKELVLQNAKNVVKYFLNKVR